MFDDVISHSKHQFERPTLTCFYRQQNARRWTCLLVELVRSNLVIDEQHRTVPIPMALRTAWKCHVDHREHHHRKLRKSHLPTPTTEYRQNHSKVLFDSPEELLEWRCWGHQVGLDCTIALLIHSTVDFSILRADHVMIQSYEEELDEQRLYVALFVKDPYRQSVALTNGQVLQALEEFREELFQDIKHQVKLIGWREKHECDHDSIADQFTVEDLRKEHLGSFVVVRGLSACFNCSPRCDPDVNDYPHEKNVGEVLVCESWTIVWRNMCTIVFSDG